VQSAVLETETLLQLKDIRKLLKATHQWWQAIGELIYLHLERPEVFKIQDMDEELVELWGYIAYMANRNYYELNGEFIQARATAAIVSQNVHDIGYSPEFMGSLIPTVIGIRTTVIVPVLTSLVIDEFMGNTWGPAN
jgi:hypothetical protein